MTDLKEASKTVMFNLVFTREAFVRLCEIWPNPETGVRGLNQSVLSRHTGISQGALSNYMKEGDEFRYPRSPELRKLGEFFEVIMFVEDWCGIVDNEKQLKMIEAFLHTHAYKKAS